MDFPLISQRPDIHFGKYRPMKQIGEVGELSAEILVWSGVPFVFSQQGAGIMLTTVLLLAASVTVGQGEAADAASEKDLFKEYGRAMVGHWAGDVQFGDNAAAARGRAVIRWAMNETALECEGQIGDLKVKWTGGWDPVSKTIRNLGFDSAGTMTETVIAKQGNEWVSTVTSLLADGTKRSNTETMTISDNGNTHVHEGTSIGPKVSKYRGVWKRVEQNTGPDYEQLKAMQWLIGDWEADYLVTSPGLGLDGFTPGAKVHSTCSFYWMENRNYIGLKFRDEVDGKVGHQGFEMIGVDPKTKKKIHWLFSNLGGWGLGEWTLEGETWKLKWAGTTADGTEYEGVSFMVPVDANTYTWEMKDCKKDGKLTPDTPLVTFHRSGKANSADSARGDRGTRAESTPLPRPFVKQCEYYLGEWSTEAEMEGKVCRGTWTVKWSPEKACIVTHWSADLPAGPGSGTRIQGWDSSSGKVLIVDFGRDGASSIERYRIVSDQVDEGEISRVDADGTTHRATARTDRMEPDCFTWTVTEDGTATVHTFRRVKK